MGLCDSHIERKKTLESYTKLQYVNTQWTKRERALNKILKQCKSEEKHWIDQLNNLKQHDEEKKQCTYIISYWLRKFILNSITTTSSTIDLMVLYSKQITENQTDQISQPLLSYYYGAQKKGLFDHSLNDKLNAQKLWAEKRLEFIQNRMILIEKIKFELYEYQNDWETNINKKKYWQCKLCKNYDINTLFIEMEDDNFYHYTYRKEVNKYDSKNAYNIVLRCETELKHHFVYISYNLRKYEIVKRYVMHRCRVCNHNHTYMDNDNVNKKECNKCNHAWKKHDQIWCKHADEFDGSEVIKTRRFKDMNGNW